MLDGEVKKIADSFVEFWNEIFQEHPVFLLDYTWPSIGIVDKLLFPLRGKKQFSKVDVPLIQGAAAYLGIIAFRCWREFPDVNTSLYISREEPRDIVLKATGGEFLVKEDSFGISIGRSIEDALKNGGQPLETFAEQVRMIPKSGNVLSSLAIGIVSGLCPSGSGPWNKKTQAEFNIYLVQAAAVLSESCVTFNNERYAGSMDGARQELYFPNLVIPPIEYNEPHPASRAALSILGYYKAHSLSESALMVLAKNLACFPDEHISSAGFVIATALCEDKAPDWMRAYGLAHAERLPLLRPSILLVKKYLEKKNFYECYENQEFEEAEKLFQIEYDIGFFPLFFLPDNSILRKDVFQDFIYFLAWTVPLDAYNDLSTYSIFDEQPFDIQLQVLYLAHACNYSEILSDGVLALEQKIPESENELFFRLSELKGLIAEEAGDHLLALAHYEKALINNTVDTRRFATVATKVCQIYIAEKRFDEALNMLDACVGKVPYWIPARLLRQAALIGKGNFELLEISLLESLEYCHYSNHLFSFLKGHLLQKKTIASDQN